MVDVTAELASATKAGLAMIVVVLKTKKLVKRQAVKRFVLVLASVNVEVASAKVPNSFIL